jgi:hypothetical protein
MANPQPNDAHGVIAHDIQENLITRNFTEQQLKIIYLIIRLSWGCGLKAWQYNSYRDFEAIGIYKSDIAGHLRYLSNNRVIEWVEKYNLLIFNKDYDEWKIPINKKSSPGLMSKLVHESLKNSNDVRELLTMLGKIPNDVRKNPERSETETPTTAKDIKPPKESINKSIIYTTSDVKFTPDTVEFQLTAQLRDGILRNYPKAKMPEDRGLQKWLTIIDRMIRLDNRTPEEISTVIDFALSDSFWKQNILSADSLRKQFDKLAAKMGSSQNIKQDRFKDIET